MSRHAGAQSYELSNAVWWTVMVAALALWAGLLIWNLIGGIIAIAILAAGWLIVGIPWRALMKRIRS